MNAQPLVSVVTPVYNGEKHLAECIESVLAQTYGNWDYVVVNNCSTDTTAEIARRYASQDSRIRAFDNQEHLEIIPNWNNALGQISPECQYCKVLHADDWLFPECLERMVELAEANPSVGIVSSYRVDGQKGVHEGGPPYPCSVISGRKVCRDTLNRTWYIFGSPSTRLIRANLVRKRKAYYNESYYHAGPAECFEQLQHCDFGFVHQILSYTRRDTDAQTSTFSERYATRRPERLAWLQEYGPAFFDRDELKELFGHEEGNYYRFLAWQMLGRRGKGFFEYHKRCLERHGLHLSQRKLLYSLIRGLVAHPRNFRLLFD